MTNELRVLEEQVPPHSGNLLWRVFETGSQAEGSDTEVGIPVVDRNSQGCSKLVFHKFFFIFEGVFRLIMIQLRTFNWAN